MRRLAPPALLAAALAACATAPSGGPRGAGGWIEVVLADGAVPADPLATGAGAAALRPECHLELDLDGQTVLSEPLEPTGSRPPFRVDATFRVEAAAGEHALALYYAGCRTSGLHFDAREARIGITVAPGQLTRLRFDGTTLEASLPADPHEARDPSG
jgi:hypothetical protein